MAILLDNFVSSAAQIKQEEEKSLANEYRRTEEGLNPLLRLVMHLAQACCTSPQKRDLARVWSKRIGVSGGQLMEREEVIRRCL